MNGISVIAAAKIMEYFLTPELTVTLHEYELAWSFQGYETRVTESEMEEDVEWWDKGEWNKAKTGWVSTEKYVPSYEDILRDRNDGLFGRQCSNRQGFDSELRVRIENPQPGFTCMYYVLWRNDVPWVVSDLVEMRAGDFLDLDLRRDLTIS